MKQICTNTRIFWYTFRQDHFLFTYFLLPPHSMFSVKISELKKRKNWCWTSQNIVIDYIIVFLKLCTFTKYSKKKTHFFQSQRISEQLLKDESQIWKIYSVYNILSYIRGKPNTMWKGRKKVLYYNLALARLHKSVS